MMAGQTTDSVEYPELPATAWAVLGMLSFGEKLTGIELKKWADWSLSYFYWSPSVSQIYAELKRLEKLGLATSTVATEPGVPPRRIYEITGEGVRAVRAWSSGATVGIPVLKHGLMLRVWMGHLNDPSHLKSLVSAHIDNLTTMREQARAQAKRSSREPAWAYATLTIRWAERYYHAELELARDLLSDIDAATEEFGQVREFDQWSLPRPNDLGSWQNAADAADAAQRLGRSHVPDTPERQTPREPQGGS